MSKKTRESRGVARIRPLAAYERARRALRGECEPKRVRNARAVLDEGTGHHRMKKALPKECFILW